MLQEFLGLNQLKILGKKRHNKRTRNVINPWSQGWEPCLHWVWLPDEQGRCLIYLTSVLLWGRAGEQNWGVSFGLDEGMKWFEKIHYGKREEGKKDLLASNPQHTYFSDQPNINYKLSSGKINVNPGGLGSWEPELDPGTVVGRLAACAGRERGEKMETKTLRERRERALENRILGGEPGHCP